MTISGTEYVLHLMLKVSNATASLFIILHDSYTESDNV